MTGAENYGYYPTWVFQYYYALHKNALGNFKTFVEDMGRNPAMLHYLDGRLNTKMRPMKTMLVNSWNCLPWVKVIIQRKMLLKSLAL